MCLTPFAIWACRLTEDQLYEAVRLYTSLTIPHELPTICCYIYCYAIKLIIEGNMPEREIYSATLLEANRIAKVTGNSTAKYWMENDIDHEDIEEMPKPHYRPISYVKTAFCWAMYYLKHCYNYEEALLDILQRGGDTAANAAIVGGLIGALKGKDNIPAHLLEAIQQEGL